MATSARGQLEALGITPKKSLGQNFLVHVSDAARIAAAIDPQPGDVVVEIGPGAGALTAPLISLAEHVIAIELDPRLVRALHEKFHDASQLTVIHADALEADFTALVAAHAPGATGVRFAGNLPYYITSAVIRRMMESGLPWRSIVVTVQLEVAQRIVATPGDMSLLSVSTQFYGRPEILFRLNAGAFYPTPGVDSAVVRITPHPTPLFESPELVFGLARAGFGQKRKQLINTLAAGTHMSKIDTAELLLKAKIEPSRRPETLSMDEWIRLARTRLTYKPSNSNPE